MSLFTQDAALKQHAAYRQAKAGDQNAVFKPAFNALHFLDMDRFDDEFIQVFGVEPAALTANEAQFIAGFRSIDALRNRLAAAEQEIDRRLRSKGIARTSETEALGTHSGQALSLPASGAEPSAQ
jgi:hypothetical protein